MPLQLLASRKRRSRAGFTILDILLVISFVSLLAGITFPRIADVQTRFAVRGAVTAFMSAHSMARATAIRQGGVAELHVDATNDRFWVEVDTTLAGSGVMDTIGNVVDVGAQGVTLGPSGGAVGPAWERSQAARMRGISSGVNLPFPTSISVPTIFRTM